MPKTAAELVPLKTQLRASMGLFRFNDPTTDFNNTASGQWTEHDYNNSGFDPVLGRVTGTTNARPPDALTTSPTNLAASLTATGALGRVGIQYILMAYDASNRPNQATVVWVQPPNNGTSQSATLSWAPQTGVSYYRLWGRQEWGGYQGAWSWRQIAGTDTQTIITTNDSGLGNHNSTTGPPYPDRNSTAPVMPPVTLTYNTTGGSLTPAVVGYRVAAYTAMGETPPSAPVYVQPQGTPAVHSSGRVQGVAATPSITGGTLTTGTYFYVVTARTELMRNNYSTQTPWYGESLPSVEISAVIADPGATPQPVTTGSVSLTWTQAPENVGYHIYRGTATGELFYLGATGANVNLFTDTGASTAPNTMRPPTSYNGMYHATNSGASLTWSAVANAVGYWVYRSGFNPINTTWSAAYQIANGTTTAFTDTAAAATGRYTTSVNLSGVGVIRTAGHYWQSGVNDFMERLGFTIMPVLGHRYRIVIRNLSTGGQPFTSGWITASTGGAQYFEATPNITLVAGQWYYTYIQSEGNAGAFSWPVVQTNMAEAPGSPVSQYSGMFVWDRAQTDQSTVYSNGGSSSGDQPTGVHTLASVGLPIRITWRRTRPSSSLVNAAGNLLGSDDNRPQIVLTNNQTYSTPIRSIIPTWSLVAPISPKNQALMMSTHLRVEVSQDGGSTWTPVVLDQRYYFPTPATQIMFRIVFPPRNWFQSFDQALVNYPSATGTGSWRPGHQGSSSDFGAYWEFKDQYNTSNGWWGSTAEKYYVFSHNYNNLSSDMVYAYDGGADVDVRGEFWPEYGGFGEGGPRVRYNRTRGAGTDSTTGGLMLSIDNNGDARIRDITSGTASTVLATATGVALSNSWTHLRLVASGDRYLGWVNHRLVFDLTNTTYPSNATNASAGAGGRKTRVRNLSVAPLVAGGSFSDPNRQPARFELDFLAAYLEV